MRDRFELLGNYCALTALLFCQLDDEEMAYAKVLLDEVIGRSNFLNTVCVKMKQTAGASGGGEDKRFKKNIEQILIYYASERAMGVSIALTRYMTLENLFDCTSKKCVKQGKAEDTSSPIDEGSESFCRPSRMVPDSLYRFTSTLASTSFHIEVCGQERILTECNPSFDVCLGTTFKKYD